MFPTICITLILCHFLFKFYLKCVLGWDDSKICLVGKVAIVTGGNSGIGYQTALQLASKGCKVIIGDVINANKSVSKIINLSNNKNISYKYLDLASFDSVRKFANEILFEEKQLDILINNAGCLGFDGIKSVDGLMKLWQINYFGPFLLTHLLIDLLKRTPNCRIVFVASVVAFIHTMSTIKDLNKEVNHILIPQIVNYANTKLCVIIAARKFAQKYGIVCNSVHPGMVNSEIQSNALKNVTEKTLLMRIFTPISILLHIIYGKNTFEGAQTSLFCALSPNLSFKIGDFYIDCQKYWVPTIAKNEYFCEGIWKKSIEMVRIKME